MDEPIEGMIEAFVIDAEREKARKRYRARCDKKNREFLEGLLNDVYLSGNEEVETIIYDYLGSGRYRALDGRTRRFLLRQLYNIADG